MKLITYATIPFIIFLFILLMVLQKLIDFANSQLDKINTDELLDELGLIR